MPQPPVIYVLSGPNGAGKSTGAAVILPKLSAYEFVNADDIQVSLGPGTSPIRAGKMMLKRMLELRGAGVTFAFETTLSAKTYVKFLENAQQRGYVVHLIYIWLSNPQLAISRVALRVRMGGHDIPVVDIERRYWRGLRNFFELYSDMADAWTLCDNSGDQFVVVAQKTEGDVIKINDQRRFKEIRDASKRKN